MPAKAKAPPFEAAVDEIELETPRWGQRGALRLAAAPLWAAGPGGVFARERVIAIGRWDSAPMRRAAQQARREGRLLDLTFGYACKSVIFMDSGHVVLAATLHFWPEPVPFQPDPDDDRTKPAGGSA